MITRNEVLETNNMISEMNLDVRTITMGISLLDCADADIDKFNEYLTSVSQPCVNHFWTEE